MLWLILLAEMLLLFDVKKGEIFGFLGMLMAQEKTTAMKMLIGYFYSKLLEQANVAGFVYSKTAEDIKKEHGYMSQKFALYGWFNVKEEHYFFWRIYVVPKNNKRKNRGFNYWIGTWKK